MSLGKGSCSSKEPGNNCAQSRGNIDMCLARVCDSVKPELEFRTIVCSARGDQQSHTVPEVLLLDIGPIITKVAQVAQELPCQHSSLMIKGGIQYFFFSHHTMVQLM